MNPTASNTSSAAEPADELSLLLECSLVHNELMRLATEADLGRPDLARVLRYAARIMRLLGSTSKQVH